MRIRRAEHVACRGEKGNSYNVLVGMYEGKSHLKDLGTYDRIILKLILKK
jgi:hypothetical protein